MSSSLIDTSLQAYTSIKHNLYELKNKTIEKYPAIPKVPFKRNAPNSISREHDRATAEAHKDTTQFGVDLKQFICQIRAALPARDARGSLQARFGD